MLMNVRDAVSELALHFFDKMKIMVVKDIEREDIEFITKVFYFFFNLVFDVLLIHFFIDIELSTYRQSRSLLARIYGIS